MDAAYAIITIRDNSDWLIPWDATDDDDVPYDLTGSTFRMDIKASVNDAGAALSLTTANGGIVSTDLVNGVFTVVIADFALPAGTYVYDLLRLSGGARETFVFGELIIEKGVTGL